MTPRTDERDDVSGREPSPGLRIEDLSEREPEDGGLGSRDQRNGAKRPGADVQGADVRDGDVRGADIQGRQHPRNRPAHALQPRRDLHLWLGAGVIALALPLLLWHALSEDSQARAERAQGATKREVAQVRPPESTSALDRTIREQAESVTPGLPQLAPLPGPLPGSSAGEARGAGPGAQGGPGRTGAVALESRTTALEPGRSRAAPPPLPAGFDLSTPPAAPSPAEQEAARRLQLTLESERRQADALGSPVLALGGRSTSASVAAGSGAPFLPTGVRGRPALPLDGMTAAIASAMMPAASDGTGQALSGPTTDSASIDQALSRLRDATAADTPGRSSSGLADQRWLQQMQSGAGSQPAVPLTVRPSPGARAILQGTIIPAVLLTELNSDLPGPLTAQVTQDVWDSVDGRHLLIPQGARLVGAYNADVRPGQERVLAAFSRLIFPGGASVDLLGMQAADAQGRSGLNDQVDRHFWRMFGSSFVIAGLASLIQRREAQPATVVVVPGTTGGTGAALGSAAGTVLVETARTALGRTRNLPPTLVIRQGHRFVLTVQRDFLVPEQDAGTMLGPSR